MRNFLMIGIFLYLNASLFAQLVVEVPIGGGLLGIRNDDNKEWVMDDLDFHSVSGDLVPAPALPGSVGDPGPFAFMLSNTPEQVTYGSLGTVVRFPARSCTFMTAGAQPNSDIRAFGGSGPAPIGMPVDFVDAACGVPEPNGTYLAALGLIGFVVAIRRRKRQHHQTHRT